MVLCSLPRCARGLSAGSAGETPVTPEDWGRGGGQRRELASVVDPVARAPQRCTPRKRASIQARKLP